MMTFQMMNWKSHRGWDLMPRISCTVAKALVVFRRAKACFMI
jgi:hypothetical protein